MYGYVSSLLHVRNVNIVDLRRAKHASDVYGELRGNILSTLSINNCDTRETYKLNSFACFNPRIAWLPTVKRMSGPFGFIVEFSIYTCSWRRMRTLNFYLIAYVKILFSRTLIWLKRRRSINEITFILVLAKARCTEYLFVFLSHWVRKYIFRYLQRKFVRK